VFFCFIDLIRIVLNFSDHTGTEKENARKQTLEQLHERRKQVVRLHKKGIKLMQIVAMTGLSDPVVRACIDLFYEGA
jgi:DNA-directed RNA polymerase specialized sigma subunit